MAGLESLAQLCNLLIRTVGLQQVRPVHLRALLAGLCILGRQAAVLG